MVAPGIKQYFTEYYTYGKIFTRNEHSLVYQRDKNINSITLFGTLSNLNQPQYNGIKHSIFPTAFNEEFPRFLIGSPD